MLSACDDRPAEKLVITGSSTVAPVVAEIAKRYETKHPGVRIDVQTGGSSRGINDARKKLADIGMASRAIEASEQDLMPHTLAWDGITLIVHKDNPLQNIDREHTLSIYKGEIDNWKELGGADAGIVVVNKAEGRSTLEVFLKHYGLKNTDIKADLIIGDNQQGLKTVAGNPNAIAYVSIGAAAFEAEQGSPIKLLSIDGVASTLNNVEKGVFPIARPLNMVTVGKIAELPQDFIQFALSSEVTDLIEQQFLIPANAN